jgi:hypothetical protein
MSAWSRPAWLSTPSWRSCPLLGALVLSYGLVAEPASVIQHVQA